MLTNQTHKTQTHTHTHTHTRTHAHTHTRTHAHAHTRTHAHTHTRTHAHIRLIYSHTQHTQTLLKEKTTRNEVYDKTLKGTVRTPTHTHTPHTHTHTHAQITILSCSQSLPRKKVVWLFGWEKKANTTKQTKTNETK